MRVGQACLDQVDGRAVVETGRCVDGYAQTTSAFRGNSSKPNREGLSFAALAKTRYSADDGEAGDRARDIATHRL